MRILDPRFLLAAAIVLPLTSIAPASAQSPSNSILPEGTLLRVELDRTSNLKDGAEVIGHLIDAVYLTDRSVLNAGLPVTGHVAGTTKVPARDRVWQLLDGDVTPTKRPEIVFDTLTLANGEKLQMNAPAMARAASLIHMQSAGKHGKLAVFSMAKTMAHARLQQFQKTYMSPGKKDRFEQFAYGQLPYHPQRVWRASQFDAELAQPLSLGDFSKAVACAETPEDHLPAATLHARLVTGISSRDARAGQTVQAILAQPVYADKSDKLLLPEGAQMSGVVMRAKPARLFGRPGVLRFTLKQVTVAPEESCALQARTKAMGFSGQVTSVESAPGENVKINSEGEAEAGPSPNRLLAPLALTVLLARTFGEDGSNAGTGAVSGGGFGLAGRVVSLAARNANVTSGFAYYALTKSVIRRFILKGHEVEFPRNTRFDIDVSTRALNAQPMAQE